METTTSSRSRAKRDTANGQKSGSESLTRADWIEAAWDLLGEGSVDRVRVEPLAKHLGVTKGSFYWHFKDRSELVEALLDRWFDIWEGDQLFAAQDETDAEPGAPIWNLCQSVIQRASRAQTVSFRLWSHHQPAIAERIKSRDNRRLAFLVEQFEYLGFPKPEATVRGQLYQTVLTGEFLRNGALPLDERLRRAREQHRILIAKT